MSNIAVSELIFISAMMMVLLAISFIAVYVFFRQLKREKAGRAKLNAEMAELIARREAAKKDKSKIP